jgi:hypothetical protein
VFDAVKVEKERAGGPRSQGEVSKLRIAALLKNKLSGREESARMAAPEYCVMRLVPLQAPVLAEFDP